jgi:hypothetical protein
MPLPVELKSDQVTAISIWRLELMVPKSETAKQHGLKLPIEVD